MLHDLDDSQRALADAMSDLSEAGWCAGWMQDTEFELWRGVVDGPFRFGRLQLTSADVERLRRLSAACGGWIVFDGNKEETFVPLDRWNTIYRDHTTR